MSHPTWVRGLKFLIVCALCNNHIVAPHMGAWIEIGSESNRNSMYWSHPTWVRGLKYVIPPTLFLVHVAPHMGAWIEI